MILFLKSTIFVELHNSVAIVTEMLGKWLMSIGNHKVTICDFENEYDRYNRKDRKRRTGHKS